MGKTIVIFEDVDGTIKIMPKTKLSAIKLNIDLNLEATKKEVERLRKEWR